MFFKKTDPRRWFEEKRYGLFVHWGIYAVHALHEQEEQRYHMPREKYERCAAQFNPRKFDPEAWIDQAEAWGMEYLVFTVKHHDGFCMWNTRETDFNVMNTPCGRDLLRELADACHRRRFPLELYYSCVDWHQESYPNLGRHHEIVTDPAKHDLAGYAAFVKAQIRELCTNYGEIHGIWWDMNVPQYVDKSINALIRQLQPSAVINNRGFDDSGDFSTPERDYETAVAEPAAHPVEACNSVGMNSWGYRKEEDYFSCYKLEKQLATYLSLGGNYLLNAGPDADGRFPAASRRRLDKIGAWFRRVKPALTAHPRADFPFFSNALTVTASGDGRDLYLIMLTPPEGETLLLSGIDVLPEYAEVLNTHRSIEPTLAPVADTLDEPPCLRVRKLPVERMYGEIPVLHLHFAEPVRICGKGPERQKI